MLFLLKNAVFGHTVGTFFQKIAIGKILYKKLMPIPKRYVLTLNKKNKIFFQGQPPKKIKGGGTVEKS